MTSRSKILKHKLATSISTADFYKTKRDKIKTIGGLSFFVDYLAGSEALPPGNLAQVVHKFLS